MRGKLKVLFMEQAHLCADRLTTTLKSYLLMQSVITDLDGGDVNGDIKKH